MLARGLGTNDREFVVLSGAFATGRGELDGQLMKIGSEWLRISGRDGRQRDTFRIDRRAQRGTTAVAHAEKPGRDGVRALRELPRRQRPVHA